MTAIEERLPLTRLAAKGSEPFDFAGLVRTHQVGVWRYVRFLGAEAAEADDLTQETFLALRAPDLWIAMSGRRRVTCEWLRGISCWRCGGSRVVRFVRWNWMRRMRCGSRRRERMEA